MSTRSPSGSSGSAPSWGGWVRPWHLDPEVMPDHHFHPESYTVILLTYYTTLKRGNFPVIGCFLKQVKKNQENRSNCFIFRPIVDAHTSTSKQIIRCKRKLTCRKQAYHRIILLQTITNKTLHQAFWCQG